jgi:GTP cyclohydrolase II
MQESFKNIIEIETNEHSSCPFKWDCDNCYKSLCLQVVGVADFPTKYGNFEIIAFTNNKDKKDHIAIVKGDIIHGDNILTRLHSSCLTGDVLGSLRCDCGPQLHKSLSLIEKERLGIILYMQQEGRGIGLKNKIKAYMLQDLGSDTYDANLILGFKPDERQYELAAAMLRKLDVKSIRLLTNNPNKIRELERFGVKVEKRVSLEISPNKYNKTYLKTKKTRFNHILSLGYEE